MCVLMHCITFIIRQKKFELSFFPKILSMVNIRNELLTGVPAHSIIESIELERQNIEIERIHCKMVRESLNTFETIFD